jgi:UDP-N-acetyl-D-mannosaminuronic acid transferase (WecB/TagA/CpsF family)
VEEDAKLIDAVKEYGDSNWSAAAELVPTRTNAQCRTRWAETLDLGINRGYWTAEEDVELAEAVTELGNDWVQVAVLFPGRSNN